jgi:HAD superfamily hydrolase (TIGR01509 family)
VTERRDLRPRAITFDFGNTLVPVDRASMQRVVDETTDLVSEGLGPFDRGRWLAAWDEERLRQFREEVPRFREVDLGDRFVRLLARMRGMAPPAGDEPWNQTAAARLSDAAEIDFAIAAYSGTFVRILPPRPVVGEVLAGLAEAATLAILSNWPHAATVDRYVEAAGWDAYLAAVVVSQRIGTIKPHPAIFEAARLALGEPPPASILHVGDDWAADVVGASRAGWQTAYLRSRPDDSPLPASKRDGGVVPDLELDDLVELLDLVDASRDAAIGRLPD